MKTGHHRKAAGKSNWRRPVILIAGVILLMVIAYGFDLGDRLKDLQLWIQSLGPWAPVIFSIIYAAATVAAVPGSAMTVVAGAIFGSVKGVIIVSAASTIGAALSFIISRYLARPSIENWLRGKEKFKRLDRLARKHGAVIVAVTRLVPLFPFNLLNYGFGLTGVRFTTYIFWSWLCMLPGCVLYVVGADAVIKALSEGRVPWSLVIVLCAALGVIAAAAWIAARKIREK